MRLAVVTIMFTLSLLELSSGCRVPVYDAEPEPKKPKQTKGETLPSRSAGPSGVSLPALDAGSGAFDTPGSGVFDRPNDRPADAGTDAPARACPGTYRGPYMWKPPPAPWDACTTSDIGFFEGLISAKDAKPETVEAAMRGRNVACASCIFSVETDATWGPYVYDAKKTYVIRNVGACYASAPGGSEACGQAVQEWYNCMWDVCGGCGTEAAMNECWEQATTDPNKCNRFDFVTACNGNLPALDAQCWPVNGALTVTCGAGG